MPGIIPGKQQGGEGEGGLMHGCVCASSSPSESLAVIPVREAQVAVDGPWHQGKGVLLGNK